MRGVDGRRSRPRRGSGRLLEHDVGVGAAEAEGADARAARLVGALATRRSSVLTKNGLDAKSICGFGERKLMLGGMRSW